MLGDLQLVTIGLNSKYDTYWNALLYPLPSFTLLAPLTSDELNSYPPMFVFKEYDSTRFIHD